MGRFTKTRSIKRFDDACRFIIKLGLAVHKYGSTAVMLEAYLAHLTAVLGYRGAFRSTPTEIVFAFQEREGQWQQLHLATKPGVGLDLDKLAQVGDLVHSFETESITISDASARLDEIDKRPLPWGKAANSLSYAFVGSGLAVLLAGGWIDVLASTCLSILVYGIVLFASRRGARAADWLPFSSAFVAAVLATAVKSFFPGLNIVLVTLAAIIVLIPGYSISLGIIELVNRHVVSGAANLTDGLFYLAKQFLGAWLGVGLMEILFTIPAAPAAAPVNVGWLWLFMPLLIIGLCVVFQTAPRDFLWACIGCVIAYGGILLGSAAVNVNVGNLLGTIFAVVFANLWATWKKRPTTIVLLPAVVLLVSGSIGFRGLAAIAGGQTMVGAQQFFQMFVVALTIAAGLLVGNTIVRPKVTL